MLEDVLANPCLVDLRLERGEMRTSAPRKHPGNHDDRNDQQRPQGTDDPARQIRGECHWRARAGVTQRDRQHQALSRRYLLAV